MRNHIIVILAISLLMYTVVSLNIPILRQILCFIYLSFIPGFAFLKVLKLKELSVLDRILMSVGLSIAIFMFLGLLMNALYPIFGIKNPLSILPSILTLISITLIFSIISYHTSEKSIILNMRLNDYLTLSTKSLPKILLLICVPVLAICGAWFENSPILLLMVLIIAILTVVTVLSKRLIPTKLYPFVIIVIATSLLFHMSLISKYLIGHDIFLEYYVYKLTKSNFFWNVYTPFKRYATLNACLSVTVLPTLISSFLNIQDEWIFQIVYLLIYSFVPLTLYRTWEQQTGKLIAFLSTFCFMFIPKFYTGFARRQTIAELFLALLFLLIVHKKINGRKRGILLIIFGAALVVSHYSTSYIFLFTIFFAWFFSSLLKKNAKVSPRTIDGGFVLLFFVMAFSWYVYVSSAPSNALWRFINNIWNTFLSDFLNLESRGSTLYEFVQPLLAPSFLHIIGNFLSKILYFFIVIGFLGLFIRRMRYTEIRLDWEFALMMTANVAILFAVILFPGFGPGFVTTRFFHLTLFLLAPLCVVGGETFFKWIQNLFSAVSGKSKSLPKNKALSLVCVVLVVIFLFKTGFVYEATGDVPLSAAGSISLSKNRMEISNNIEIKAVFFSVYVPEQDVFSAIWVSKMIGETRIYADSISLKNLIGYGMINPDRISPLTNDTTIKTDCYIYLRYQNVIDGTLIYINTKTETTESLNMTEVSHLFTNTNKIYSNGDSQIHQSLPK